MGLGIIGFGVFVLGIAGVLSRSVVVSFLLILVIGSWKSGVELWREGRKAFVVRSRSRWSSWETVLGVILILWVLLNGLASMAPLTGSDPMMAYFVFPKLYAKVGSIYPGWWRTESFFLGPAHMLVLLGMILKSETTALAINFLGSILTVWAVYLFSGNFLRRDLALLAALLFSISPMVYWQATSGLFDLWTVFYTILSVYAFLRWEGESRRSWLWMSGLFGGIAASCKYTVWTVPLFLGVFVVWLARARDNKFQRLLVEIMGFMGLAMLAGIWPHVRNFLWTGDPFFPFLTMILKLSPYATFPVDRMAAPPAGFGLDTLTLLLYPIRMIVGGDNYGGGHFYGPLILSFAPFLVVSFLNGDRRIRILLFFCVVLLLFNATTTQSPKFLFPVFPILLVLSLDGMVRVWEFCLLRIVGAGVIGAYLAFGLSSNIVYAVDFLPVVMGQEPRDVFLQRKAADYDIARFVNATVPLDGKVAVMFPHVYYLERNYIRGGQNLSWLIDFSKIKTGGQLQQRLRDLGVTHVVKVGSYEPAVSGLYEALEACCMERVAQKEVTLIQSRRRALMASATATVFRLRDERPGERGAL